MNIYYSICTVWTLKYYLKCSSAFIHVFIHSCILQSILDQVFSLRTAPCCHYTAGSGNSLLTFRYNPSAILEAGTDRLYRIVGTTRCVTTQKNAFLIYIAAEAWGHAIPQPLSKRVVHRKQSSTSSFSPAFCRFVLRLSITRLRLLPRLSFTFIVPFIMPSTTCFRNQVRPIQSAFTHFIVRRIFIDMDMSYGWGIQCKTWRHLAYRIQRLWRHIKANVRYWYVYDVLCRANRIIWKAKQCRIRKTIQIET
jgi:hypothetical protein